MNPDSTTPPLEDGPPLEADLPGFLPPTRPTLDQLDPSTTTVTELPPALTQTPPFERDELDDLEEPPERTSPRPERTSRPSAGNPTIASAAAGLFALVASVASLVVNATVGRGSGAYVMQPEEAQAIGDPLGRIAARHAPIGDGDVTDVSDGIEAGVAATAYAARASIEHFSGRTPAPDALDS